MTNEQFCQWFAERGHKWRGFPEWEAEGSVCRLAFDNNKALQIRLCESGNWLRWGWRADHEAACLIRDKLMFGGEIAIPALSTREKMNAFLHGCVELALKAEAR